MRRPPLRFLLISGPDWKAYSCTSGVNCGLAGPASNGIV
jgi:hypothetical protein